MPATAERRCGLAGYVATITAGDFTAGGKLVQVRWIKITDAGRRAIGT